MYLFFDSKTITSGIKVKPRGNKIYIFSVLQNYNLCINGTQILSDNKNFERDFNFLWSDELLIPLICCRQE